MKLFASLVLVVLSTVAQASKQGAIAGPWVGDATVHGQQVPLRLVITGRGKDLQAALLNGPQLNGPQPNNPQLNGPDRSPASSVSFVGNHLLITFNYYARTLDATVADGHLTGTFGTIATRYPVSLTLHGSTGVDTKADGPAIPGDWEVEVKSSKGESAWQLRIEPSAHSDQVKAVIQRIDGDTGALYGGWTGHEYLIGHFTAAGPALYSVTPQSDGTLLVSNKLRADVNEQQNLTARRPAQARAAALPGMTDPTQQTTVKDPSARFAFSFPDLNGKLVSNTDPQFDGKVVIVAIGGSWCPNCHDEAPMLESLYKQFHSQGLEVVNLSFEEADQLKEPTRLRAFIEKYGLTYTVLVAGETEQLNEKIPQGVNLNCWPTSFFLGRDGRVREVHAGFAGPANPPAHEALVKETTELVEKLLAEPVPAQSASLK
ncbi:TlpA disulfide reductase family protein [Tunturibacter empetritectus]|uniref:TlpA disulfide reductase family protein n=1 Tax=Tunturiibacter empetritectus TaxID=3069691 RepID=A0AAU7ZDB7_9BACT